jgi:hypothetical protein
MAALSVMEDLDVFEDCLSCLIAGLEVLAPDQFMLDRGEEAFCHGVDAPMSISMH